MGEVFRRQGSEYNSMEEFVNVFSPPDEEEDHGHLDVSREQELSNSQNVSECLHNERDDLVMEESQNTQNESDNFVSSQSSDTSNTTSGYGSQESMNHACEVDITEMGQDLQCMETDNSTNGESGDVLYVSTEDKDWYMNFIKKIEYRLDLREIERIKSINGVLLDRHDTRQNGQELFDKEENFTVIIERKTFTESGDIETDNESYEECLEVRFVYNWCKRDSLFRILHHKIVRSEPVFRDINFNSSSPCKIRSVSLSGNFLTCRDGKLTLAPIENESDKTSQFTERRFSALQSLNDGGWSRIQLRTFESISENKYISAKLLNDVKLKKYSKDEFSTTKPDNRFFKLRKSRQGDYFLESVINPGTYLCWIKNKIELKIFYPGEMTDVESNPSEENICLGY